MVPLTFLAGMLTLTLCALVANVVVRRGVSAQLRRLASQWRMQYGDVDRFQLLPRVIGLFPIPGASDLALLGLIYTQEADQYRYFFTIQYTEGVVRTKTRVSRVAMLCEPRDRNSGSMQCRLTLAPTEIPWCDQYTFLLESCGCTK